MTRVTKKKASESGFSANEQRALFAMASILASRANLASRLGMSFGEKRDIYEALGYPKSPGFDDYVACYKRQDVARAIIDAPVRACWRKKPRITESKEKDTDFEKAWRSLVASKGIYHYLSRVDKMASIGCFAILFMGLDDGIDMGREAKSAKNLLYLMPYSQSNAIISTSETDKKNPRYGLPATYSLTMKAHTTEGNLSSSVHWSRVIHVAEDCLEDNVLGLPSLEPVLNRLIDLERVAGGSSEMFWRGAFPGYGFKQDPGTSMGKQDLDDLKNEIEDYMHKLQRYIRLRGISVENLAQQVSDPSNHVGILIDLIACAKRIPKRILMGSERGELASSQDERAWNDRIDERRREHCEPVILRPFIDRLITVGVLPRPAGGYAVEWPSLTITSAKENAEVAQQTSMALKNYVDAMGADQVVPPEIFLREVLGFSEEVISEIELIVKQGHGYENDE